MAGTERRDDAGILVPQVLQDLPDPFAQLGAVGAAQRYPIRRDRLEGARVICGDDAGDQGSLERLTGSGKRVHGGLLATRGKRMPGWGRPAEACGLKVENSCISDGMSTLFGGQDLRKRLQWNSQVRSLITRVGGCSGDPREVPTHSRARVALGTRTSKRRIQCVPSCIAKQQSPLHFSQ